MLNSVPCIGLSGENGQFMIKLKDLDRFTHGLDGGSGAWRNTVNTSKLRAAERIWISSLMTKHRRFSGFKEVRLESIPFVVDLFPNSYHVINY